MQYLNVLFGTEFPREHKRRYIALKKERTPISLSPTSTQQIPSSFSTVSIPRSYPLSLLLSFKEKLIYFPKVLRLCSSPLVTTISFSRSSVLYFLFLSFRILPMRYVIHITRIASSLMFLSRRQRYLCLSGLVAPFRYLFSAGRISLRPWGGIHPVLKTSGQRRGYVSYICVQCDYPKKNIVNNISAEPNESSIHK